MAKTYTVALAGLETLKNKDGSFRKFSVTFLNNILTWITDHPKEDVEIVDARDFHKNPLPMPSVWEHLRSLSEKRPIDLLLYQGHSGSTQLYYFSKVRKDVPEEQRYFCMPDSWEGVVFSPSGEIKLYGCQTGGEDGKKFEACIAQSIADATKRVTWGFVSKSSQRMKKGKYYQVPDVKGLIEFRPK